MKYALTLFAVILMAPSFGAEFRGISASTLLGHSSEEPNRVTVTAISGDGSTIGGSVVDPRDPRDPSCAIWNCGVNAFVWTHESSQLRDLGRVAYFTNPQFSISPLLRYQYPADVFALAYDGSTSLVTYKDGYTRYTESAIHRSDGITGLRDPSNDQQRPYAQDMSPDGSVVVGMIGDVPSRWTVGQPVEQLSDLPAGNLYPTSMSADGSTLLLNSLSKITSIEGLHYFYQGFGNAWTWADGDNATELLPLAGLHYSAAAAMSQDGRVVVGTSKRIQIQSASSKVPSMVATAWIGSEAIALDSSLSSSSAIDVSADGTSIVGTRQPLSLLTGEFFSPEAMLWREGQAYRIQDLLTDVYGLDRQLAGWQLTSATAISFDGQVIAGEGIAPDGQQAAWVAVLRVPEPSALVLLALGALLVIGVPICRLDATA